MLLAPLARTCLPLLLLLAAAHCAGTAPATPESQHVSSTQESTSQQPPQHHQGRCRLTRGRWCGLYHSQQPIPARLAPAYGKTCPANCSGVGVCNAMTGQCDCPAGWTGAGCAQEQKRPCTDGRHAYRGPGTLPSSHIGPDKRDLNWTQGDWSASRCAGVCDDKRGLCYCGGPSQPGAPANRPLSEYCQPQTTQDGQPAWGRVLYEDLFGQPYGWCNAAVGVEPAIKCGCPIDGQAGTWCEAVTEQVCPNSCSGHGRCDGGFCVCETGWFGHDCAGRVQGQQPEAFNESTSLQERPWLAGHLVPPVAAARPPEGATRKRPLIFVYDSPAWAAARMMQYRGTKRPCTWRFFDEGNTTHLNTDFVYAAELLLHEMLLASSHRTMDPEEADIFYVPAYVACYAWPVLGWADFPWWYSAGGPRVSHMSKMLLELKQHIQKTYPFWNRTNGRDHIWLAPHDEGACWFPTDIYEHSIILTHWGRMDPDHTSNTAFAADNYSQPWVDSAHKGYENVSWTELIKGHPCYTPGKDLVIPSPKFPPHYRWSPLLGAPPQPRDTLLFFRGDIGGKRTPNYSRGIRQQLHVLAQTPEWKELGVKIGTREEVAGDYSRGLASSKFCLVAPGDGWSGRAEDAILHGCIPVIVQDSVHAPFESVLDFEAFSLRVSEQQLDRLAAMLAAVTARDLRRMQRSLRRVWHRFAYLSQPLLWDSASTIMQHWQQQAGTRNPTAPPQQQGRRLALTQQAGAAGAAADAQTPSQQQAAPGMLGSLLARMQQVYPAAAALSRRKGSRPEPTTDASAAEGGVFRLTPEHAADDAFGTVLQWLHARSLQLHKHRQQHVRHPAPASDGGQT